MALHHWQSDRGKFHLLAEEGEAETELGSAVHVYHKDNLYTPQDINMFYYLWILQVELLWSYYDCWALACILGSLDPPGIRILTLDSL